MLDPNETNLAVYRDRTVAQAYDRDGWIGPGESELVRRLASETRGTPLLDIGVGAGRTTSLLALLADDYIGVDYSPEMIDLARRRYPWADLRVGDARSLSDFDDGQFGAVVFTYNGLDGIAHEDRAGAFAEMRRVLRPGGWLLYSTLNMDGPQFRAKPWEDIRWPTSRTTAVMSPTAKLSALASTLIEIAHRARIFRNWLRIRTQQRANSDWGLSSMVAHDYRMLVHFITVPAARREVTAAGFELVRMVSLDGESLNPSARWTGGNTVYILAQRKDATA